MAGIDRGTHYDWLKADPGYKAAFEDVQDQAAQALEDEAVRRAYEGVERPVYQGGEKVGVVREYSDTLLIFLLKGAAASKVSRTVRRLSRGRRESGAGDGPRPGKSTRSQCWRRATWTTSVNFADRTSDDEYRRQDKAEANCSALNLTVQPCAETQQHRVRRVRRSLSDLHSAVKNNQGGHAAKTERSSSKNLPVRLQR
jgi:hypothetical protein